MAESNPESYENAVPVVKALADLGHYSQLYFSAYKGWTIGEKHTAMPAYGVMNGYASEIQSIVTALEEGEYGIEKSLGEDIEKATFAVDLDASTAIKLYFKPTGECEESANATVDGGILSLRYGIKGICRIIRRTCK